MSLPLDPTKARHRETWAAGDYPALAAYIQPVADHLCDAADLQAGWKVLDIATGSGNCAIAAARCNCRITGLDLVPELLDRARVRTTSEGFSPDRFEFVEGDAENLPFADAGFDAVTSVFGVMFAPDQKRAASEVARVCRKGGRIGLASWTPDGFAGQMFKAVAGYLPPPPGAPPAPLWGTEAHLAGLFGGAAESIRSQRRAAVFRYESTHAFLDFFRARFGPLVKALGALTPDKGEALGRELLELAARFDRNKSPRGPVAIVSDYLESVIIRA
jgi:SAM-dependent methyltransferase